MDEWSDEAQERLMYEATSAAFGILAIICLDALERERPVPSVLVTRYLVLSIIEHVRYKAMAERI